MIRKDDYEIFNRNLSTLKEVSKDSHDAEKIFYMTNSLKEVVDFDNVKDEYIKDLGLNHTPKSNDGLLILENGDTVFIEFKNGKIGKNKKVDLLYKAYDSILIFADIIKKGINYTREHTDFIVVYNYEKNSDDGEKEKTKIQDSSYRTEISKGLSKLGKENFIQFGLERFKGYCFRNIYTYTEDEFEEYISGI